MTQKETCCAIFRCFVCVDQVLCILQRLRG